MARLKTRGLRKTVGVPGLFATAYGNVGSSIYYALGLVAAHALGLTPLVFMFAGGLFALTAKTYAEGAAMFPEAGGSSSFARHAFNEVVSFIAGWGLSLDYILTIAISAFFVPHYLGAFFPALGHSPGDMIGGVAVIAFLVARQHPRPRRVGQAQHRPRGPRSPHPGGARRARRGPRPAPLDPDRPGPPRRRPQLLAADLRRLDLDARLHRDRDRLQHGRGGARPRRAGAESGQPGADRGARHLRRDLGHRPLGAAGDPGRRRPLLDRAGHDLRRRPGARHRLRPAPARRPRDRRPLLRRRPGGDDPADRDQRRDDRHLAALLVAGRAPPAARRLRQAPSRATTRPGSRSSSSRRSRSLLVLPGNIDFLGNLYSFGAMLSFTIAHLSIIALRGATARPLPALPGALEHPLARQPRSR